MFFEPVTRYPFPKPPPATRAKLSKDQLEAITRERHALALEMRKFGYSYEQIAEHFETSPASARGIVKNAMEHAIREPGQEIIDLELARLDQLYGAAMSHVADGDADAITKCLAIMARRAKLLGIDAPDKKEVSGLNGGPIQFKGFEGLSDAELATMKSLALKAIPDES